MRIQIIALAAPCLLILAACAPTSELPLVVPDLRLVERPPLETACAPEPAAPEQPNDATAAEFDLAVLLAGRDCRDKFHANLTMQQDNADQAANLSSNQ